MELYILKDPAHLGESAAEKTAQWINEAIDKNGQARIVLSTGASQFDTIESLIKQDVDWTKVEMFHLDEYVDLPKSHPASFRKYLQERFVEHISLKKAHFVDGEGDVGKTIESLTKEIRKAPIDVALIGIGENAHIAFNDPPADFETKEAYIVVDLDEACKRQQVGEGWFETVDDVPSQAISMTVYQIMESKKIVSCVPYKVKAQAIYDTLHQNVSPNIPATILKQHPDFHLYLDEDSASKLDLNK